MADIIPGYTVQTVVSPQWANAEETAINCTAKFAEFASPLPFTASPNDMYSHSIEIFNNCVNGAYGEINPYAPPTQEEIDAMEAAMADPRDAVLTELQQTIEALTARLAKLEGATK